MATECCTHSFDVDVVEKIGNVGKGAVIKRVAVRGLYQMLF